MPRYIRQRNNYSCGPVALLNALKWAGRKKCSYKDLAAIQAQCRTAKETGTSFIDMAYAARLYRGDFSVVVRRNVTMSDIGNCLRGRGAVILGSVSTFRNPSNYHYFLITDKVAVNGEVSYRTVNFDGRATQRLVSAKLIKDGLRLAAKLDSNGKGRPYALLLRRR